MTKFKQQCILLMCPAIVLSLLYTTSVVARKSLSTSFHRSVVKEPSDITYNPVRNRYVVIGDKNFQMSEIDSEGKHLFTHEIQPYKTGKSGFEAIAFDQKLQQLVLLTEGNPRKKIPPVLVYIDPLNYRLIQVRPLKGLMQSSPEGLAIAKDGTYFIALEKSGEVCRLNEDRAEACKRVGLADVSGLYIETDQKTGKEQFWVTSDKERTIATLDADFQVQSRFYVPDVAQLEGMVLVSSNDRLQAIVVDDQGRKIGVLRLP